MSILYLDLETVPQTAVITEDEILNAVPGNIKKVEEWLSKNRASVIEKIIKQRSLSPYQCKIVCLSFAFQGQKVQAITGKEETILEIFASKIKDYIKDHRGGSDSALQGIYLVGHNIKRFDAPILFLRAIKYNNHTLISVLKNARKDNRLLDTMEIGTYHVYGSMVSLDTLCYYFNVESPKTNMDGSKVFDEYQKGNIEEIAKYCNDDVEALIKIFDLLDQ